MQKNNCFFVKIVIILLIALIIMVGCSNINEPENLVYVLFLGIEKGEENRLRLTYLFANPSSIGGPEAPIEEDASVVATIETPSIYTSLALLNTFIGPKPTYTHIKGIIFSKELAEDGSMSKLIATLPQFRDLRETIFLAVSLDSPEQVIEEIKPKFVANPGTYYELLISGASNHGYIPRVPLRTFYNLLKIEGINPVAPLIASSSEQLPENAGDGTFRKSTDYTAGELTKKGGVPIQILGTAAFRDGKMVGEFNGTETVVLAMLKGTFQKNIFSIKDPINTEEFISVEIFQALKPKLRVSLTDEGTIVSAKISLKGDIMGATSLIDYGFQDKRRILEKALADQFKKDIYALIERTQKELKTDIIGFGSKARKLVLSMEQYRNLNWDELYEFAEVDVEVDLKIRRTGINFRLMPIVKPDEGIKEGGEK